MKTKILALFILTAFGCGEKSVRNSQFETLTASMYRVGIQDYTTVNDLRNETIITPRHADKVFVRQNKGLYYYDSADISTFDDGLNTIVQQPNRRWKLITHIQGVSSDQAVGTTNNTIGNVGINTPLPIYTLDVIGVDGIRIPVGTSVQRPLNPNLGVIRYNTTTSRFEGYNGTQWVNLSF